MIFRSTAGRAGLRRTAAAATAAGLALTLAACGSDDDSGSSGDGDFGELSLQLSWVKNAEFLGEYMATRTATTPTRGSTR